MPQSPTPNTIQNHLAKLCASTHLNNSQRYTQLLRFLVEQALAGNELKEAVIGNEIFGSEYNPVKDDGKVRVYMYNLRKRLTAFYAEDIDSEIAFYFEKGNYNLKIKSREKQEEKETVKTKPQRKQVLSIVAVAVIALVVIIAVHLTKNQATYCWESFFQKGSSTSCVLADQVVLNPKDGVPGEIRLIRDVNSASDFIAYTEEHQIDDLEMADYTFYTKSIPQAVHRLSRWFFEHGADFRAIGESEFRYEETKRSNILYIGQQKTMSVSEEIFLKNSKAFSTEGDFFVYVSEGKATKYQPSFAGGSLRFEYAMVSYMPLGDGKDALYFVSNHDIGTMATVQKFTNPDFLSTFYKKMPSKDAYFNALFKVEGLERTDMSCELVALEILE